MSPPAFTSATLIPLGHVPYESTIDAMQRFTAERTELTLDEIWFCEHPSVFTQGVAGRAEHVLNPHGIPIVQTNRGGQVTYHGPGQVVVYPLIDLKRLGIFVKEFIYKLEHCILLTLEQLQITGHRIPGAPGIYVRLSDPGSHAPLEAAEPKDRLGVKGPDPFRDVGKIAALGIKVSRHSAYHGLALNVNMDLAPFSYINPCGYAGLQTVDLASLGVTVSQEEVADLLGLKLVAHLRV
jgi:lipoyl(octanoyl) transferase